MQELKEMGMLARQAARMLATAGEAKKMPPWRRLPPLWRPISRLF